MLGKAETSFNVRLNNHQKDVKKSTPNGLQTFSTGKFANQLQQT